MRLIAMSTVYAAPANHTHPRGTRMPNTTAIVAAFATCPDGNEPKSVATMSSSGLARPNRPFSSCTATALAIDAERKKSAAQGRLSAISTSAAVIGTTNTPMTPPPSAFIP
ncbi:hypothetical protein GCM10025870_10240 [Agromyces marinus]|uniref:Uncharacterized protein n=1 Tax=Agromyces marinus TaxID=1389020 RepID=A0ABM8GZN4_9MICO|nr:hypothetical protein GCM10025870_10240 [Agromyces marinus]